MVNLDYKYNAKHLEAELRWFRQVVETRYQLLHQKDCVFREVVEVPQAKLNGHPSPYQTFLNSHHLDWKERFVLVLALVPHIQPHVLDDLLGQLEPQFVGDRLGNRSSSFVPTIETALFLLAGDNLEKRFLDQQIFDPDAPLLREKILSLDDDPNDSARSSAHLVINQELLTRFTSGKPFRPDYSHRFPAQRITTTQEWDDLILDDKTSSQITEIQAWIKHGNTILYDWGLSRKFSPGYKCLFYGPPGTGKTMTAALLGQQAELDVYRIDLSMVISKYIGETEKNLRHIFDTADKKRWILFFDEAEALFGKRTEVRDAHDRFANQEVSYLLHRIEQHDGLVILATNKRNQLDDAFTRRFQTIVPFPMPGSEERYQIWHKGFSSRCALEKAIDLKQIADRYELAGGSIMNVIRYASLMALEAGSNIVMLKDLMQGIQREYAKEGKTL